MTETKHDKFIRIAESRTNKIIEMIRLLGNCSNTATYEYEDSDIKKVFSAIEGELKNCRIKFQGTDSKDNKFKLR